LAPDSPLPVYAAQREIARAVQATALRTADAPDVVAKVIVAAATDSKPNLRYTAGSLARRVSLLRRIVACARLRQVTPQARPTGRLTPRSTPGA